MKPLLLAALLLSPAQAFFGSDERKAALLFAPDPRTLDWDAFLLFLARRPDLSFTLAVPADQIPENAREAVKAWAQHDHAEVAARIAGDPLLPLTAEERERDAADRVALARVEHRKLFGVFPEGFMAGAGLLSPKLAAVLERQKLSWTAVGEGESAEPWLAGESLAVLPFRPAGRPVDLPALADARGVVVTDWDSAVPGRSLADLEDLLAATREDRWTSVRKSTSAVNPYSVAPDAWPGFRGSLEDWRSSPLQRKAWRLYGSAARAVIEYQNSGTANLAALNKAADALYTAQDQKFYRAEALADNALDKAFRGHLKRVHQLVRQRAPNELMRPMSAALSEEPSGEMEAEEEARIKDSVIAGANENTLWLENPQTSRASLPKVLPPLPAGATAEHLWTPVSLRVSWTERSVAFTARMKSLREDSAAPNGFADLQLELYIDINHLTGRGATALLPGRRGFLSAADAWEFALAINGQRSALYRSLPGQPPALVAEAACVVDARRGEIRLNIPRASLRGNPSTWGYLLLAAAIDEAGAKSEPPEPAEGSHGSPYLGLLGTLADQKRLADAESNYRRFTAVRLETAAP